MKISEIFSSIEGEGLRAGAPCVFVRLSGCNLRCAWCDTAYALGEYGKEMTVDEVLGEVARRNAWFVTVTGGEPLASAEGRLLVRELLRLGYSVNVETNGSFSARELIDYSDRTDGQLLVTMDWKLPSSLMERFMCMEYINELTTSDVLKFVVSDEKDLERAKEVIESMTSSPRIYLSPVWGKMSLERLAEFVIRLNKDNVRMQVQLHKLVWGERRGV